MSYKDNSGADLARDNTEYAGIVRPQYQWLTFGPTWLEAATAWLITMTTVKRTRGK
ncbi:hypothetical protein O9992_22255 [Vibrio lentus]|nr:hypothetical protein [Vibrio lentus]